MCLKEFHTFTFSNREALDRLTKTLWAKYGNKTIKGLLHKAVKLNVPNLENTWNDFTFDELMSMRLTTHWFIAQYLNFRDWKSLKETLSELGDCQFVFGRIEVEIR